MSRDMVWYKLYEALLDNECPICRLLNQAANDFIGAFLYENVNDPGLRQRLRNSKGLCSAHAWLLHSYGEPLAHAIIYGDLLQDAIADFGTSSGPGRSRHAESGERCLLCGLEDQYCRSYLLLLDETIGENRDFQKKFAESGILCVPHMKQYAALSRNSQSLDIVRRIVTAKYAYLQKCLSEIRRKNDYRFSGEPWTDDERAAWSKAVRIMAGRRIDDKKFPD